MQVTIKKDGTVTIHPSFINSRSTVLMKGESGQYSKYMVKNLYGDSTWDYIKLMPDGTLGIRHYCDDETDPQCSKPGHKFGDNYCCSGTAERADQPPGNRRFEFPTLTIKWSKPVKNPFCYWPKIYN